LREHPAAFPDVTDAGAFVHHASADTLRGRKEWRRLLERARRRQHPRAGSRLIVVTTGEEQHRLRYQGVRAILGTNSGRPAARWVSRIIARWERRTSSRSARRVTCRCWSRVSTQGQERSSSIQASSRSASTTL
jgi:hypothetical protein